MAFPWEDILKIICAALAGAILGVEREYRSKPAGLRTLIMITVGSALFSILSLSIHSESPDRIASNIVTGVGFVGGGVIFKEGLNVKGVTTAATIWIAAAIGMAFGFGEYWAAVITLAIVLITLTALSKFENRLNASDPVIFRIAFNRHEYNLEALESEFSGLNFEFKRLHLSKKELEIIGTYQIEVPHSRIGELNSFLINNSSIKTFDT